MSHNIQRRKGRPLTMLLTDIAALSIENKIRHYSLPPNERGCEIWTGARAGEYASVVHDGQRLSVARWLLGLTDPKVFACHHCDTPACVARAHLFAGSPTDNVRDMIAKGRARTKHWPSAEHPSARLTTHAVQVIRFLSESTALRRVDVAGLFGVSSNHVLALVRRTAWAQTPDLAIRAASCEVAS